ncbi:MAG: PEP-CTERM sorting domain-containing protein [Chthoniobacterales bacterium]|nr:PEP-CTERM sorting domain-containing protein [Chthoniobacterales bacterium]
MFSSPSHRIASFLPGTALALALALTPLGLHAANVTWDGNGTPNASGSWETGANWSTDAIPGTGDGAFLLDVTTGTRTVTVGTAQTINRLTLTQTTVGAVNQLNINADLTISGNNTPFVITPTAGQGSIVTNIASGVTLLATNATGIATPNFNGTLNLAAGSVFKWQSTNANTDISAPTFGGPVNATGSNAQIIFNPYRFVSSGGVFNGAVSVSGSGSSLTIQRINGAAAITGMTLGFHGDDGSGNAVSVGTGSVLNFDLNASTANFTKRVSLAAGGALHFGVGNVSSNSTSTMNLNAGLDMGVGAFARVWDAQTSVTVGGTSTWAAGSEYVLRYARESGTASFTNTGVLAMDDANLTFDWAATSSNNGARRFVNTGTWTLDNGSEIAFVSTTGRPTNGGYLVGVNNDNSGVLNVQDGSRVGFLTLFNTGTLNAGSSSGGVSEAQVMLGSPDNTFLNVTLTNGVSSTGVAAPATLNFLGNVRLGRTTDNGDQTTTLVNGSGASTGSVVNVGDGATPLTVILSNRNVAVTNYADNTMNLTASGTLHLASTASGTTTAGNTTFTNDGTLNHAGTMLIQGNFTGSRDIAVGSTGVYRVQGAAARITALGGVGSGENVSNTRLLVSGTFTGSSASDVLTFKNATGKPSLNYLVMTGSGAHFTPGNGSNGAGTSSIGSLELVDTNLTLTTSTLTFDIGGTQGSGLFDELTLTLATGSGGAVMALGTDSILDIRMVNGFLPASEQTYQIIGANSRTGTFGTLLYNGAAVSGEYTVNYLSNGVEIVMAAVPEPTSILLTIAGLFFMLARRRK